jgi:hypothetical protein
MKIFKLLVICLISSTSFAQYDVSTFGNSNISPVASNTAGLWIISKGTSENIGGSLYLFDNWDTNGYLTTIADKKLSLYGMNYDTKSDAFVVKISKDSIFMFDDSQIKEVIIDNKRFKKYDNVPNIDQADRKSYLEVLANTNDIEILKFHGKILKLGIMNPLTQISTPDKYIDYHKIYFKKGATIKEIKLNKKEFSEQFDSKSKEIKKFISENKISLKEEKNLQKILNYYNSL